MNYSKEIVEYIKVKCEGEANNAAIARDVIKTFDLLQEVDIVRRQVSRHWDRDWEKELRKRDEKNS